MRARSRHRTRGADPPRRSTKASVPRSDQRTESVFPATILRTARPLEPVMPFGRPLLKQIGGSDRSATGRAGWPRRAGAIGKRERTLPACRGWHPASHSRGAAATHRAFWPGRARDALWCQARVHEPKLMTALRRGPLAPQGVSPPGGGYGLIFFASSSAALLNFAFSAAFSLFSM